MKVEEWKDVIGFEGLYMVSNLGRVKSLERIIVYSDGRKYKYPEKILRQTINKGYKQVKLSNNSKVVTKKVHRLVAEAFLKNENSYPQVNHKDECTINNNVDNLEWCTQKDNVRHGTCQQRRIEKVSKGKIIQYDKQGNIIKIWNSLNSLRLNGHVAAWRAITRGNTNRFHDNSFWFRETERFDITKGKCLTLNIK